MGRKKGNFSWKLADCFPAPISPLSFPTVFYFWWGPCGPWEADSTPSPRAGCYSLFHLSGYRDWFKRLLMQPQLVTPRFSGNAEINHLNEERWTPNKEAGSWWQPAWSPDLMLEGWEETQGETEPLLAPMFLLLEHVIPLLFKLIWAWACFSLLMRIIYHSIRVKEISSRNFRTARMQL